MTRADELEAVARVLCLIDGIDPDSRIDKPGRAPELVLVSWAGAAGACDALRGSADARRERSQEVHQRRR
jgi:hypothetical protein